MNTKTLPLAQRAGAFLFLATLVGGHAMAQLPIPASTQFDVSGFIQEASLDATCTANSHCGGTLKVNGHLITVPKETIVILPANQLTWQELFAQAPAPFGIPGNLGVLSTVPTTGLAENDCGASVVAGATCTVPPLTTYEAHVIGNRVVGTTDQYIAGLISISQHALNSGAGFINAITNGVSASGVPFTEFRVGGVLNNATTGTRVRLNDPLGVYGVAQSPDKRFTVDTDNPTVTSDTGFPMCFPRAAGDAACPAANRPVDLAGNPATIIQMQNPVTSPGVFPSPLKMAPFAVGDYVTFAGTLVRDITATNLYPTVGPWPAATTTATGTASTYVSAHTVTNNVAIFTWPGVDPAYVRTDVSLIGTGGLTVLGAAEPAIRTRFEGMSTDPSRAVHIYGMDLSTTGAATLRDWGMVGVDPGAPAGAIKGRWRFRTPCTATPSTVTFRLCSPPPAGIYLPPTREVMAKVEGAVNSPLAGTTILSGQYHAPINEYIFPENVPGSPIVPNNFEALPFLLNGGYMSTAGTLAGVLNPWPGAAVVAPPPPPPGTAVDVVTLQSATYRTTQFRLIIQATSTTISPSVDLFLQPYVTANGTTYNPDPAKGGAGNKFTNNGGGLYILDVSGVPEPAVPPATPLVVKSSLGGTSVPTALTLIRQ